MKHFQSAFLSLILGVQLGAAQGRSFEIKDSGETTVSTSFGETKLVATFRTSNIDIGSPPFEGPRRFVQCTYGRFPCSLTEQIQLYVNGREIGLPRSAYADLGDIATAEFSKKGHRFVLTIEGGDASESYIVHLFFNKERLLERRFYHGEDPYSVMQVTRYYETSAID